MSAWTETGETGSLREGPHSGTPGPPIPIRHDIIPCPEDEIGSLRRGPHPPIAQPPPAAFGHGAGRALDFILPQTAVWNANPAQLLAQARQGLPFNNLNLSQGGATASTTTVVYKGRVAHKLHAPNNTDLIKWAVSVGVVDLNTAIGGADDQGDFACWRVKALLAFAPAGSGDLGVSLTLGSDDAQIVTGIAQGVIFRPDALGVVRIYAGPQIGLPTVVQMIATADIDVTEYNCYEYRLISAKVSDDALLRFLINGVVQLELSWAGNLPEGNLWVPRISNMASGDLYVPIGGWNVSAANNEDALL